MDALLLADSHAELTMGTPRDVSLCPRLACGALREKKNSEKEHVTVMREKQN